MATWFRIEFEGEPTEDDFARVAELAAEGFTSGQLINEPEDEDDSPITARWFTESKTAGCTGTGYDAELDAIEHADPGPCPVHPGL